MPLTGSAPGQPHVAPWTCMTVLLGADAVLTAIGMYGFQRRAVD